MAHPHSKTDPVCKMKGHIKKHGHYFCSEQCLHVYEAEYRPPKWYENKLTLASMLIPVVVLASYFFPLTRPVFDAFADYLGMVWWAILLGLGIGGFIDYCVPDEYISKHLSGSRKRNILKAVTLGFFMSACSHGILAIAIELYRKGASVSSVVAFLLASPWANLPVTFMLFGFFGIKAVYFVLCAMIIAVFTGLVFQALERMELVERNPKINTLKKDFSVRADVSRRVLCYSFSPKDLRRDLRGVFEGAVRLSSMVMGWLVIGMFMASLGRAYIPPSVFAQYFGPSLLGLAVTLVSATIIEVCSEGSSPIAFEIFNQSGAFGNSFVFLMAGVVTDYTEIGLLWSNIGKRTAILLPIITVPQTLVLGYLFNILL